MVTLITVVHVIAAVFLILVVLLQSGKGASMGAAFGGASQTVFGASGAGGFLSKLTVGCAVGFMVTSLLLAYFSTHSGSSLENAAKEKAKLTEQKSQTLSSEGQSVPPPAAPGTAQAGAEKPAATPGSGGGKAAAPAAAPEAPKPGGEAEKPPEEQK
jgi:preprotein translocase subunit SecG